ncbi:MAG: response regulator [SAR324 cluster bacterium]|nr:response regulator [SAR324 cluster bacterium]
MPTSKDMKILIVDDFTKMRAIMRSTLRKLGYDNVIEADNGESALIKLQHERVDFVIADWNMPKMSGLELLKEVRKDERFKDLPFLMVTAEALPENVIAAIRAGVNNYVVKPYTQQTLDEKINSIFK